MTTYIIRRLLLMIPTFILATALAFTVLQLVPSGPYEEELMKLHSQLMMSGEAGGMGVSDVGSAPGEIPEEAKQMIKEYYGLDKPAVVRYFNWLGLWPKEMEQNLVTFEEGQSIAEYRLGFENYLRVEKNGDNTAIVYEKIENEWVESDSWKTKLVAPTEDGASTNVKIYKTAFAGILTGNLGDSWKYHEPVWNLIKQRIHISAYFGLVSFLLSYLVCIPLGIWKAIKHGSKFDVASSVAVFVGYSTPGFLLGSLLLIIYGGGSMYDVFPLGEFRSEHWEYLTTWEKINDQLHHSTLVIITYMVGAFASLTVLMKNSLLENLSQDYVRTAFAKGLSERRVIFYHTVRNSLIPLATGIGGLLGIWLAGSYLVEKIFNIDGIGMLSYTAILTRDYPIILGFLAIGLSIRLLGNLISDMTYAAIDPRIRFK